MVVVIDTIVAGAGQVIIAHSTGRGLAVAVLMVLVTINAVGANKESEIKQSNKTCGTLVQVQVRVGAGAQVRVGDAHTRGAASESRRAHHGCAWSIAPLETGGDCTNRNDTITCSPWSVKVSKTGKATQTYQHTEHNRPHDPWQQ